MIGLFDSGYGGLMVLKALLEKLPEYDYVYLGDSARAPYGDKSQAAIFEYTKQGLDFLFSRGCELVILACNTASAKALRKIQQEYLPLRYPDKKVLGVLIPAVEELGSELGIRNYELGIKKIKIIRVGIIGTRATIESKTYEIEIHKILNNIRNSKFEILKTDEERQIKKKLKIIQDKTIEIYVQATPLLVPLVEEGLLDSKITELALRKYLRPLKEKKIDFLILGCTHYPLLLFLIRRVIGKRTKIISTPEAVAKRLTDYLKCHPEIEQRLERKQRRNFFTTGEPEKFLAFAKKVIKEAGMDCKRTDLLG